MAIEPPLSVWQLPDPADADPDFDVVALGADLAPGTVLAAYRAGMFPMHVETGDLAWWSPDPRGILPLDVMRVPRSLKVSARRFDVTVDRCFTEVMRECADDRRDKGWITDEFIETYTELHRLGWAHSVEAWTPAGDLAGGLYGLEIGGLFAGESMFHRETDASKVALLGLVDRMRTAGGARVLDVQWRTDHLATLGAIEISRARYLALLAVALDEPACLVG